MIASIAGARHQVLLESYIFADDEIGNRFAEALAERARAGVIVRMHLDAAGSLFWASHRLIRKLEDHGVLVRWFHRWDWRHPWRYNRRNHRKLLVVDGHLAYVGGYNIHRENSLSVYGPKRWRDTHVAFSGTLASDARELFGRFWIGRRRPPRLHPTPQGSILVSNFSRGGRRYLNGSFASLFSNARDRIYVTTPYFVPDRRTQRLLSGAARRGVDVRVLVPRKHDVRLAQWAAHAAYDNLLQNGVRIFEYLPRLLHAKTAVVDGRHATVGTANIDYRSFFLNYELNLFTRHAGLCRRLERTFLADLEEAEEVFAEQWKRRFPGRRALELIGWMARRWL
ncbi:MAG TPA: cardiolipin synthase B [Gammaproteobacteria bacterium]|nr:cardiolipin synthase B [Gammaproteobacteria bacterium]